MEYDRPPSMEETREAFELVADTDIQTLDSLVYQLDAKWRSMRNDPRANPAEVAGLEYLIESRKRILADAKAVEEQLAQEQQLMTESYNDGLAP